MVELKYFMCLIPFQTCPLISGSGIFKKQHAVTDTCTFLVAIA